MRTKDELAALRAQIADAHGVSDDELRRRGAYDVVRLSVAVPGSDWRIPLLVVRPTVTSGPLPLLFFIHGGGMICGTPETDLRTILRWTDQIPSVIAAPDYRLAPEHPHPIPVEDCYGALSWAADHADELGVDARKIVVCGPSAGGGLSAATVLLARDRGLGSIVAQVLMCPMLDDRANTVSAHQMIGRGICDKIADEAGWTALLGDQRGAENVSAYASPARATDLSGLPPTFIDVGSAETFRDEAITYASRIWAAGGDCELHVWAGGFHGYTSFVPTAAVSQSTQRARLEWLHRILARASA
jgi:acetyl esterase/lipase